MRQNIQLSGAWESRRVFIDGVELFPDESRKIINHSPDNFNWGFAGSGPAQLALAICLKYFKKDVALKFYQRFKTDWIATLPESDFDKSIPIAE